MATPDAGAATIIRIVGVFDLPAAHRVVEALATSDGGSEVYVDLTHVRDFDDRAIAVLGNGLSQARGMVAVRGLLRHHYRMMRYLGVRSAALEPSFDFQAAET